jgi:hypothetical protein
MLEIRPKNLILKAVVSRGHGRSLFWFDLQWGGNLESLAALLRALLLQCNTNCVAGLFERSLNSWYVMNGIQKHKIVDHPVISSRGYGNASIFELACIRLAFITERIIFGSIPLCAERLCRCGPSRLTNDCFPRRRWCLYEGCHMSPVQFPRGALYRNCTEGRSVQ